MNKLFLIVLAICLVSTHAFVKRDAPASAPANTAIFDNNLSKNLQETFNSFGEKMKEAFDPNNLKESFNKFVDNVASLTEGAKDKKPA